jgi:hypothetical protein
MLYHLHHMCYLLQVCDKEFADWLEKGGPKSRKRLSARSSSSSDADLELESDAAALAARYATALAYKSSDNA